MSTTHDDSSTCDLPLPDRSHHQPITSQGTFILYAVPATIAFLFFAAKVPETKNRSLEEIQEEVTADDR